ncbi:MAG: entericidin EcnA/B family protein [Verrucomicrobiota bacterium]
MTLTALLAGFSGCNTMEGVGEDVGAAGRSLDRTAEDAAN